MNETPTPPKGYRIIPRAYLEAGNPLPGDAMFSTKTGAWIDSYYRYSRVPHEANEDGIDFYATAQPLPCFQSPDQGQWTEGKHAFPPERVEPEPTAEQRIAELERDNAVLWEQLADRDKLVADYRAQLAASDKDRMRLAEEILSTGDAKDRERLDWLEEKRWGMSNWLDEDCERVWLVWDNDAGDVSSARSQTTLRAAIDAAMKEAK